MEGPLRHPSAPTRRASSGSPPTRPTCASRSSSRRRRSSTGFERGEHGHAELRRRAHRAADRSGDPVHQEPEAAVGCRLALASRIRSRHVLAAARVRLGVGRYRSARHVALSPSPVPGSAPATRAAVRRGPAPASSFPMSRFSTSSWFCCFQGRRVDYVTRSDSRPVPSIRVLKKAKQQTAAPESDRRHRTQRRRRCGPVVEEHDGDDVAGLFDDVASISRRYRWVDGDDQEDQLPGQGDGEEAVEEVRIVGRRRVGAAGEIDERRTAASCTDDAP